MRVLVVEDDTKIAKLLKTGLESENFVVDVASDGEQGEYLALANNYDAVLLDRILPKKEGSVVCYNLRKKNTKTRIIIVSALGDPVERTTFLEMGADDYIMKPFSMGEVIARVKAVLRRSNRDLGEIIKFGDFEIDLGRRRVLDEGKEINLSKKEYMLLKILVQREGKILSRAEIMENLWDGDMDPFSRVVETYVSFLRKKVKFCEGAIKAIPGTGYRFDGDWKERI